MNQTNLICKACGNNTFAEGKLDGYANVRPVNNYFSFGSKLTLTICKRCGEVASMKVDKFEKF